MAANPILAVFDFDHSFIRDNSDTYPFHQLCPELIPVMKALRKEPQYSCWTDLMDEMLKRLFQAGISHQRLVSCLEEIPLSRGVREALEILKEAGATFVILSDANSIFIDAILEAHGLKHYFADFDRSIFTNPAWWQESELKGVVTTDPQDTNHGNNDNDGNVQAKPRRCRVKYYHQTEHGCERCPRNLCKGQVMDEIISRSIQGGHNSPSDVTPATSPLPPRIIYLGDGGGDVCACLRLKESDWVLAKKDWKLHKTLAEMQQCDEKQITEETKEHRARSSKTNVDKTATVFQAQLYPWEDVGTQLLDLYRSFVDQKE